MGRLRFALAVHEGDLIGRNSREAAHASRSAESNAASRRRRRLQLNLSRPTTSTRLHHRHKILDRRDGGSQFFVFLLFFFRFVLGLLLDFLGFLLGLFRSGNRRRLLGGARAEVALLHHFLLPLHHIPHHHLHHVLLRDLLHAGCFAELVKSFPERHIARIQGDLAVADLVLRVEECHVVAAFLLE